MSFAVRRLVAVGLVGLASLGMREAFARSEHTLLLGTDDPAGACNALTLDYTVGYVPSLRAYGVTGALVTGIDPSCEGRTLRVTFTDDAGLPLAQSSARVTAPTTSVVLTDPAAIDAARVGGVSVAVLG